MVPELKMTMKKFTVLLYSFEFYLNSIGVKKVRKKGS